MTKIDNRCNFSIEDTVKELLSPGDKPLLIEHSLDEFKTIYKKIQEEKPGTLVDVILNNDYCIVQFSRLCQHRIYIKQFVKNQKSKKLFSKDDFQFASIGTRFHGLKNQITLIDFLWEELSTNWLILLISLIIFGLSFFVLTFCVAELNGIRMINELIITISTLFISVFVLFTVSQNSKFMKDNYLFKSGLAHRFFKIDKYLALLSIFPLFISVFTLGLIYFPGEIKIFNLIISIPDLRIIIFALSLISVSILINCFTGLVRYYFERVRYVYEKRLNKEILDKIWTEENSEDL